MPLESQVATVPERTTSRFHQVSAEDFAELTRGDGATATVQRLAVSERSARLIVLYGLQQALLDQGHDAAPLAAPAVAWRLLTEASNADRAAADRALTYPHTGIWAAHMFRRLRGVVTDDTPLWPDLGYLHAVAAVAAIRAGLDFAIDIPIRDGVAVLPGSGYAEFAGLDAVPARVESLGGVVTVTAAGRRVVAGPGEPGWRAATVCRAEAAGAALEFVLDDFDPYRNMRGYSAPAPLSAEDVERWRGFVAGAWTMLVEQDRERAESVGALLDVLVPIPAAEPYRPLSASCDEAFAAVLASLPDDSEQLACTLVHETQHVRLGALLHLVRFVTDDIGPRRYAPWRDDPRPLPGLLQGIYAFVGIIRFWRGREHGLARFEFALWRLQAYRALAAIAADPALTEHGRQLVANLGEPVRRWMAEPVDPEILAMAEAAAADHYGQWRSHHLPVPAETVETVAGAWLAGEPCPALPAAADPDPVVDRGVGRLDSRAVLVRIRLSDPQAFEVIRKNPAEAGDRVPGAVLGDASFVAGAHAEARDLYERHLAADPGDPRGWLGLGLSMAALGERPAVLLARPELVRAVARRLAASGEPVPARAFARWCDVCRLASRQYYE